MSKKRSRQTQNSPPTQTLQTTSPDARREVAARASKALRSAEAAQLRQAVIQAYNQEVYREQVRTNPSRPITRQSIQPQSNQRRVPSPSELRNTRMPSEVRHQLQDGIRTLACNSRRTRKEVIFAMRRAGKAGARNKKAKWTEKSYMRCK